MHSIGESKLHWKNRSHWEKGEKRIMTKGNESRHTLSMFQTKHCIDYRGQNKDRNQRNARPEIIRILAGAGRKIFYRPTGINFMITGITQMLVKPHSHTMRSSSHTSAGKQCQTNHTPKTEIVLSRVSKV